MQPFAMNQLQFLDMLQFTITRYLYVHIAIVLLHHNCSYQNKHPHYAETISSLSICGLRINEKRQLPRCHGLAFTYSVYLPSSLRVLVTLLTTITHICGYLHTDCRRAYVFSILVLWYKVEICVFS